MPEKDRPPEGPDEHFVCPQAAWQQLKAACGARRTVYIHGAPGAGKTHLAAAFLAGQPYRYLSLNGAEAAALASLVPAHFETPCAVVLDDLHALESDGDKAACERFADAMSAREDVWLLLLSRAPVPRWLKPALVRRDFLVIGEDALRIPAQAQAQFFASWGLAVTEAAARRAQALTWGNALYLRICALYLRICALRLARIPPAPDSAQAQLAALEEARQDVRDYYDITVFDRWPAGLQAFLEALSVIGEFDLAAARRITGVPDPLPLLERTKELGDYLTEQREAGRTLYRMCAALRSAMRRRLSQHMPREALAELLRCAGDCCRQAGDEQQALQMYEQCGWTKGISDILIENARRDPAAGAYFAMRRYYLALPEERIRASVELMAGMCILQSMLLNVAESERWYGELVQRARQLTDAARRAVEARLVYLDIVLPHRGTAHIEEAVLRAQRLITQGGVTLPGISVTSNTPSLLNGGKDFCTWMQENEDKLRALAQPLACVLGKNGRGVTELAAAELAMERGTDDYEAMALVSQGRVQAENGGTADQLFVAMTIFARLSLVNGRLSDARGTLDAFRRTVLPGAARLAPNFHALEARFDLYGNRTARAHRWLAQAPGEDTAFDAMERYRYLTKARVYLMEGRPDRALVLLDKLLFYAQSLHRTYIEIETLLLRSIALRRLGQDAWQAVLQQAVSLAERFSFARVLTLEGAGLWDLLRSAALTWRDLAFRRRVMAECERTAHFYPTYLQERPKGSALLSGKALRILRLQEQGLSVDEIAREVGLSRAGVKYYNQSTYKKLGVNNKAAAVAQARQRGLL